MNNEHNLLETQKLATFRSGLSNFHYCEVHRNVDNSRNNETLSDSSTVETHY